MAPLELSFGLQDSLGNAQDDVAFGSANSRLRGSKPAVAATANDIDVNVKEIGTWSYCGLVARCNSNDWSYYGMGDGFCEGQAKKNHPGDLVDYLGVLPVSETGGQGLQNLKSDSSLLQSHSMPMPPATETLRCNSAELPEAHLPKLTLFYAGAVRVYDNVSVDKAQFIMSLAGSCNLPREEVNAPDPPTSSFKRPAVKFSNFESFQDIGQALDLSSLLVPCQPVVPKALPLARRASLARFLEKRKERARMLSPYVRKRTSTSTSVYNGFWGAHGVENHGSKSRFGNFGLNVGGRDWLGIIENASQVSESESATY